MQTCFVAVMAIFAAQVDLTIASKHAETLKTFKTTIAYSAEENQTENARSLNCNCCCSGCDGSGCDDCGCNSCCDNCCAPAFTPYLTSKGQQCPAGHAIDDKTECENDVMTKYDFVGEISKSNRPFGCFLTSRNKKYYNSAPPVKSKVFKHTRAICKGGDDFAPPAPEYTLTGAKKGRNCAEDKVIKNDSDCKEAASALGKSFKKSVTSKTRPAGCYFKGGKAWFNTNTAMYAKGRYGKFTGVCKAGN